MMKKLVVSKAVKSIVPQEIINEMYFRIVTLPATGMKHKFSFSPDGANIELTHTIPLVHFSYKLHFLNKHGITELNDIIAFDTGDKVMLALATELKE